MNKFVFLFFLIIGRLFVGCANKNQQEELPILAATWIDENGKEVAYVPPAFSLVDQHNNPFTHNALDGKIHVIDFFFTSCPTICPQMTNHLKIVQDHFKDKKELTLISFSIDARHDKPERLKAYADRYGIQYHQWKLLHGGSQEIFDLSTEYKIRAFDEGSDAERNLFHDGTFVLLDQKGRVRGYYDGTDPETPEILIADIEKL